MLARVCLKCGEYITINECGNYNDANLKIISFELDHEGHELVTITLRKLEKLIDFDCVDYFYNIVKRDFNYCGVYLDDYLSTP